LQKFILLFYTDGKASYPDFEIQELKTCGVNFLFHGYCEFYAEKNLRRICQELNGPLNENVKTDQLGLKLVAVMDGLRAQQQM
jgi:hypothetical protein